MFLFLNIRFRPEYFLNISVNISVNVKNVILEFRPLYFAQKYAQNAGNAVSETQNFKYFRGGVHVLSLFNSVTYPNGATETAVTEPNGATD